MDYDRKHYQSFADSELVDRFYAYITELEGLVAINRWDLESQFRIRWCSFKKAGKRNAAFGIAFGSEGLYLYIKWVEMEANEFPVKMSRYNDNDHQAEFHLEPRVKHLEAFEPLLELAYQRSVA